MTLQEMNEKITKRSLDLLKNKKIKREYNLLAKRSKAEARSWLIDQSLFTLLYSHEERVALERKYSK